MPKFIISVKEKPFLFHNDVMVPLDPNKVYEVIEKQTDKRTIVQNSAQWKWFEQIANLFNSLNLDITMILKMDTKWNRNKVKANIFDPVIDDLYNKKSSTLLKKDEYDLIINTMTKAFGNKGITLPPFPSINSIIMEQLLKDKK